MSSVRADAHVENDRARNTHMLPSRSYPAGISISPSLSLSLSLFLPDV